MAITTVRHAAQETSSTKAKRASGFSLAGLFSRAERDDEPQPFTPDEQSRWVLDQVKADLRGELGKVVSVLAQPKRTAASPTDLDGAHPAYLLRRLAMLALDLEIDPKVTFEDAVKRLQWAWDMLNERAAGQSAFERHTPVNAAEAAADGALMAAAARRGKPIGPGSERGQVVVAEIVDRAAKAQVPTELQMAMTPEVLAKLDAERVSATAVLPVIETVTVAGPASPVHVPGADPRPALPVESAPLAAPLPRRGEITVLPAGDNDPSKSLNPLEESLLPGSWVQDEGSDTTGRFWWRVLHVRKSIGDDGPWTRVEFANGQHRNVDRGKTVTVLNPDAAARMLTEHVAQLAAKAEAEQADTEAAR